MQINLTSRQNCILIDLKRMHSKSQVVCPHWDQPLSITARICGQGVVGLIPPWLMASEVIFPSLLEFLTKSFSTHSVMRLSPASSDCRGSRCCARLLARAHNSREGLSVTWFIHRTNPFDYRRLLTLMHVMTVCHDGLGRQYAKASQHTPSTRIDESNSKLGWVSKINSCLRPTFN